MMHCLGQNRTVETGWKLMLEADIAAITEKSRYPEVIIELR